MSYLDRGSRRLEGSLGIPKNLDRLCGTLVAGRSRVDVARAMLCRCYWGAIHLDLVGMLLYLALLRATRTER